MRLGSVARRLGASLGAFLGRLSLRARLLLGLITIAAVGLAVTDVVVYGQIKSYLSTQIDEELGLVHLPRNLPLDLATHTIEFGPQFGGGSGIPPGTFVEVTSLSGSFIASTAGSGTVLPIPPSVLKVIASETNNLTAADPVAFTTHANHGGEFRAQASPTGIGTIFSETPAIEVVAIPLSGYNGTLNRLVLVDLLASAGVLAVLIALGFFVVRIGMRPLVRIEETAEAIAAGDLSRRIELDDESSEVGRLGRSLNMMLTQIEHAFSEQQASESRLRQFLADASHELRTPVTSVRGYAELFRRGAANDPADLARAMRRIEDEAARMGLLVDDLLLLARLDQGRPLESEPVDLAALAIDVSADAQVLAPDRSITVNVPEPVLVSGDRQRLRQVVTNLLQNALRHTPNGTPIDISVTARDDEALLVVHDEGSGVPPEHLDRIFERFYRADPSRTRESGGSGLGLAIVRSIAEAHGGHARLDPSPAQGATFLVELPIFKGEFTQASELASSPVEEPSARTGGEGSETENAERGDPERASETVPLLPD